MLVVYKTTHAMKLNRGYSHQRKSEVADISLIACLASLVLDKLCDEVP